MDNASLISEFSRVRNDSISFCSKLELDDYCVQAEAFTSPPKWHLAHTTWFFETFILKIYKQDYRPFDPIFEVLFNSYYNGVGVQYPRPQRGLLTRPTLDRVMKYRKYVDDCMTELLGENLSFELSQIVKSRCELGLEHEKQHQELFFMDIKYSFFQNPLYPSVFDTRAAPKVEEIPQQWLQIPEGLAEIGHDNSSPGFYFDNEVPRHTFYLQPFEVSSRLITNIEFVEFILAGGYENPSFWLADGWAWQQQNRVEHPLYWVKTEEGWYEFTLYGLHPLEEHLPVCHISAYEADAYAAWANARLLTEQEWEHFASMQAVALPDSISGHPGQRRDSTFRDKKPNQLFGECWQWTGSAYRPYPGFKAPDGAIGEYNGKFMSNQWVLRGSACVTPVPHARLSYRNFFYPHDRWQFSGIRLARTV